MTGNSWFPAPVPTLAEVQAAIDALDEEETRTLTRVRDAVPARNEKRLVLVARLQHLAAYVQSIADANPEHAASIIESAGMYVKKRRGHGGRVFGAEPTGISGEARLTAPKAGDRAAYEFQYSLDGGKTWLGLPQPVTTSTTATVENLKRGSTVHFRYRATVKGVTGDWSDPVVMIVD